MIPARLRRRDPRRPLVRRIRATGMWGVQLCSPWQAVLLYETPDRVTALDWGRRWVAATSPPPQPDRTTRPRPCAPGRPLVRRMGRGWGVEHQVAADRPEMLTRGRSYDDAQRWAAEYAAFNAAMDHEWTSGADR